MKKSFDDKIENVIRIYSPGVRMVIVAFLFVVFLFFSIVVFNGFRLLYRPLEEKSIKDLAFISVGFLLV